MLLHNNSTLTAARPVCSSVFFFLFLSDHVFGVYCRHQVAMNNEEGVEVETEKKGKDRQRFVMFLGNIAEIHETQHLRQTNCSDKRK